MHIRHQLFSSSSPPPCLEQMHSRCACLAKRGSWLPCRSLRPRVQVLQEFHHGLAVSRIQISCGSWPAGSSFPRERATANAAAGRRKAAMDSAGMRCACPTAFQPSITRFLRSGGRHSLPIGQRQLHVFIHSEIADQVETLEMNPIS